MRLATPAFARRRSACRYMPPRCERTSKSNSNREGAKAMKKTKHQQQTEYLSDRYRPHHFQPQSWRDSVGEAVEDAALCGRPIPAQLLYGQALPGYQCPLALVERLQLPFWLTFKQAQELKGNVRKGETRNADCLLQAASRRREGRRATDGRRRARPFRSLPLHRFQRRAVRRPHACRRSSSPPPRQRSTRTNSAKAS